MHRIMVSLFVFSALFGIAASLSAQQIHLPPAVSMGGIPVTNGDAVQRQQAEAANQQRQVEIKRDSQKMFELTQELNVYLQTSSQGIMSLEAIKKAERIEKLAKSVRSKMKQSY